MFWLPRTRFIISPGTFRGSRSCPSNASQRIGIALACSIDLQFSFTLLAVNAEIIAVGSELLTPFRMDTNSLYLTEQLNQLGVEVIFKSVVGDDLGASGHSRAARFDLARIS